MRTLMAAAMLLLAACGSPYLRAGRAYVAQGGEPLAVEVLAAGLARTPDDEEVRGAFRSLREACRPEPGAHPAGAGRVLRLRAGARDPDELPSPARDLRQARRYIRWHGDEAFEILAPLERIPR